MLVPHACVACAEIMLVQQVCKHDQRSCSCRMLASLARLYCFSALLASISYNPAPPSVALSTRQNRGPARLSVLRHPQAIGGASAGDRVPVCSCSHCVSPLCDRPKARQVCSRMMLVSHSMRHCVPRGRKRPARVYVSFHCQTDYPKSIFQIKPSYASESYKPWSDMFASEPDPVK